MNSHHDWSSYRETVLCEVHTHVQEIVVGTEAEDTVHHKASNMIVNITYKRSEYYNCKAPHLQYLRQMIPNLLLRYGETLQCLSNTVSLRIFTKNMCCVVDTH